MLEKAESQNEDENAMNLLGKFYEKGLGVKKDFEYAKLLYKKASKKGNKEAERNLAFIYFSMGKTNKFPKAFQILNSLDTQYKTQILSSVDLAHSLISSRTNSKAIVCFERVIIFF